MRVTTVAFPSEKRRQGTLFFHCHLDRWYHCLGFFSTMNHCECISAAKWIINQSNDVRSISNISSHDKNWSNINILTSHNFHVQRYFLHFLFPSLKRKKTLCKKWLQSIGIGTIVRFSFVGIYLIGHLIGKMQIYLRGNLNEWMCGKLMYSFVKSKRFFHIIFFLFIIIIWPNQIDFFPFNGVFKSVSFTFMERC